MYWQRIGWRKKGRMKLWLKSSNTPSAQRDRHKCVTKFCRNMAEPRAGQGTQGFNREKVLSRGKSLSYKMMTSLTLLPHQTKQVQVHLNKFNHDLWYSFLRYCCAEKRKHFTCDSPGFLLFFFFSFPEDGALTAVLCPGMPGTRTLVSEFTTGVLT